MGLCRKCCLGMDKLVMEAIYYIQYFIKSVYNELGRISFVLVNSEIQSWDTKSTIRSLTLK